ncbi:MAG TPA: HEAT repeat domain-containing protein [Kiritimatiellia bacterium]|nr:HEAT repeat domain-containing protein [Kiritimatiellia bacterium]HQQ05092.1 HEAT repeat domain-containing protein [Kiritimatiellia bacterium]
MDTANERKLAARAAELGRSADARALKELAALTGSASPLVRRLAASAIGKLAGITPAGPSVRALHPLLSDPHPQVRQYAAKALGAFGADAKETLPDLRDLCASPEEKDYVKRSVLTAGKIIAEAVRIAEAQVVHCCRRCGVQLDPDEYARSQKAFQRSFCDHCFDEVFLDRRNFETKVDLQKTIRAKDGTWVQSDGERLICEALAAEGIHYRYDERFRILDGYAIRPDFYLPSFDVYIEYWGMDTADYKIGMLKKQQLYQQQAKKVISLWPADKPRMREALLDKLNKLKTV